MAPSIFDEESIHASVVAVPNAITRFLRTTWSLVTEPRQVLPVLLRSTKKHSHFKAGSFLLWNLLLTYLLLLFLNSDSTGFHLLDFLKFFATYLAGGLIFLIVLSWFVNGRKRVLDLGRLFEVYCYASVTFVPTSLIDLWLSNCIGENFQRAASYLMGRQLPDFHWLISFRLWSLIWCLAILVAWWLWLVSTGVRCATADPEKATGKTTRAAATYLGLKAALGMAMYIAYMSKFLWTQCNFLYTFQLLKEQKSSEALATLNQIVPSVYLSAYENVVGALLAAMLEMKNLDEKGTANIRREAGTLIVQGKITEANVKLDDFIGSLKHGDPKSLIYTGVRFKLASADKERASFGYVESATQNYSVMFPSLPFSLIP